MENGSTSIKNGLKIHHKCQNLSKLTIFLDQFNLIGLFFIRGEFWFILSRSGANLIKFIVTSKNPASNLDWKVN